MIQAIETHYKGYRFRSRLEARWAIVFDGLGVDWEYEKEGYELTPVPFDEKEFYAEHGLHGASRKGLEIWAAAIAEQSAKPLYYLPDFWIRSMQSFAEVKGDLTLVDVDKIVRLVCATGYPCMLCQQIDKPVLLIKPAEGVQRVTYSEYKLYNPGTPAHKAILAAQTARFEHGETPQFIERVKTIQRNPIIWRDIDIIVRDHIAPDTDFTRPDPMVGIHLNDGGVPLCAPLKDSATDGGFNLGRWQPRRADVLVSHICKRCIKYSLSRSKRR